VKDVKYKTAYCCMPDKRVICEFEAPDKDAVKNALSKIGIPFTTLMEAEKISTFPNPYSRSAVI